MKRLFLLYYVMLGAFMMILLVCKTRGWPKLAIPLFCFNLFFHINELLLVVIELVLQEAHFL